MVWWIDWILNSLYYFPWMEYIYNRENFVFNLINSKTITIQIWNIHTHKILTESNLTIDRHIYINWFWFYFNSILWQISFSFSFQFICWFECFFLTDRFSPSSHHCSITKTSIILIKPNKLETFKLNVYRYPFVNMKIFICLTPLGTWKNGNNVGRDPITFG